MKYKPYPAYKDSGVEWLGKVPEHWIVSPFKWQIERNDGGVWGTDPDGSDDTIVLRSTEQTVDGRWRMDDPAPRKLSAAEINAALLAEGDLVVTKSSGSALHIGKTTIVTPEIAAMGCCYSNFMQRIRTRPSFKPTLAWYVMNNDISRLQFDLLSNSTTGLANLNGTMIGQMLLAIPPVSEQSAIATFLDRETAKLDTLIARQEKLIELLQEMRQALISHAVTKGLNPDAPMKDSGVEWLGEVPEHWDVTRIGRLFEIQKRIVGELGHDVLSITQRGIQVKDTESNDGQLSMDYSKYQNVEVGDFAMNHMDLITGFIDVAKFPGVTSPDYRVFRLRASSEADSRYFLAVFQDAYRRKLFFPFGQGSSQLGRWRLPTDAFKEYPIPVPPKSEQSDIANFIDQENAKIDDLLEKSRRSIELMREHRTALISAAVTGKIDVRAQHQSAA